MSEGMLAIQIKKPVDNTVKSKAHNYFLIDNENGEPLYLGKFYHGYEAHNQAQIVFPNVEGIIATDAKVEDILKKMYELTK